MNFQEIINDLTVNRNRAQGVLVDLLHKRLVKKEPKKWRKGQSCYFSLTEKGVAKCLHSTRDSLETINTALMAAAKLGFEDHRAMMHLAFPIEVGGSELPPLEDDQYMKPALKLAFAKLQLAFGEFLALLDQQVAVGEARNK